MIKLPFCDTPQEIADKVNLEIFLKQRKDLLMEIKTTKSKSRKKEGKNFLKQVNEQIKILRGRLN